MSWKQTIAVVNTFGDEEFIAHTVKKVVPHRGKAINGNLSLLRKLGYLKRIKDGVYVKVKQIPSELSKNKSLIDVKNPLFIRNLKIQYLKELIKHEK